MYEVPLNSISQSLHELDNLEFRIQKNQILKKSECFNRFWLNFIQKVLD